MKLSDYKKVYCIGIGGIGLSAIARYLKYSGSEVFGSDRIESKLTETLKSEGIIFYSSQDYENIPNDVDLIIYTIAMPESNPEMIRARELEQGGVKLMTYPESLGELSRDKKTIAISGTHGKTTTTAMLYSAMKACGINPTLIVGSLLANEGTNFIAGDSEYLIIEACEYRRSFLNYFPYSAIITNIDLDHLDYYKDYDDIVLAFNEFAEQVDKNGFIVTHTKEKSEIKRNTILADDIDINSIQLKVPGIHNKQNAQLVIKLCNLLNLDESKVRMGLLNFSGTWRRLEFKGETEHYIYYDDYGHNPTEITASVNALIEKYPDIPIIIFFEPHLYSRTKLLLDDFAKAFARERLQVYILPIYAAREEVDNTVSNVILADKINSFETNTAKAIDSYSEAVDIIKAQDKKVIILAQGAGSIDQLWGLLTEESPDSTNRPL